MNARSTPGSALDRSADAPAHVVGAPGRQLLIDLHVDLDVNPVSHVVRADVVHAADAGDIQRQRADAVDQLLAGTLSHQVIDVLATESIAPPHDPDSDQDAGQRVQDLGARHRRREPDQRGEGRPDVVLALEGVGQDGRALEFLAAAAQVAREDEVSRHREHERGKRPAGQLDRLGPAIRRSTAERPISKPRIAVKIATASAAIVSARWWPKG